MKVLRPHFFTLFKNMLVTVDLLLVMMIAKISSVVYTFMFRLLFEHYREDTYMFSIYTY